MTTPRIGLRLILLALLFAGVPAAALAAGPTLSPVSTSGASVNTGQTYTIVVRAADTDGNLASVDMTWTDASGSVVESTPVSGSQGDVTFTRSFSTGGTVTWFARAYDTSVAASNAVQGSFNVRGNRIDALAYRSIDGATSPVFFKRIDSSNNIDPNLVTWIVVHGRNSSSDPGSPPASGYIFALAQEIASARPGEQVLVFDWRFAAAASSSLDPSGEAWIQPVGQWGAGVLASYGFLGTNLNLLGHSWGAYVSSELGKQMPFNGQQPVTYKVGSIVALDPAQDIPDLPGYIPYRANQVNFSNTSACSWAIFSPNLFGNETTATTATETSLARFTNTQGEHNLPVYLFDAMIGATDLVSSRFQLDRLLNNCAPGPWVRNRLLANGTRSSSGKFEAIIEATSAGAPLAIDFDALKNVALAVNGGVASGAAASSITIAGPASAANDGNRVADGWTDGTRPDWLQVTFASAKTIDEVDVFSRQDGNTTRTLPTAPHTKTFATPNNPNDLGGLVDFKVQYLNGGQWLDVPNGNIVNNNYVWRQIKFPPLTTTAVRVYVTKVIGTTTDVVELEAYEPTAPPAPELVVTALTAPTSGVPGGSLTNVSTTIKNQGSAPAGAFRFGFYFYAPSVGGFFTGSSCDAPGGLPAGGTTTCNATVLIPSSIPAGVYYLVGLVDDLSQVAESNEINNWFVASTGSVTLSLPDLIVTALTSPTAGTRGGSLAGVSVTAKNQGPVAAGATRIAFYYFTSTGLFFSGSSCALASGLAAGATSACTTAVNIPVSVPAGTAYLIAVVDDEEVVAESNETATNNWFIATTGVVALQ